MMAFVSTELGGTAELDPSDSLEALFREHYGSLVRLANVLLGDAARSQEVVQDAFVKLHVKWGGMRHLDRAPAYLRSAVLNGARSSLRRRKVADRHAATAVVSAPSPSAESGALDALDHRRLVAALRRLPARQRAALALRYYLDLPDAEVASAMGISVGSVKTHIHRGLATLGRLVKEEDR
jgi:RNA polymerase sigma-70 factor (sigma-E family)